MIYLNSVAKVYVSETAPPKPVFGSISLALPTDRRVAILGDRLQGKTTLLRLLVGAEAPSRGEIVAPALRLSPLANPGRFFHNRLSAIENIRLVGRMLGVDGHRLMLAVDSFCQLGTTIEKPLNALKGIERQLLEIGLLSILPFDCYLLDNAHTVPTDLLERYFDSAAKRGAGMIFATKASRQAHDYADCAVVVRDGKVSAFNQVEEAIESYERKAV
jgi:capsular polysaccharide transport system ATP-binding protein